jgi:hypothetical protein
MNKLTIVGFLMLACIACGTPSTGSFTSPTSSTLAASLPVPTTVPTLPVSITSLSPATATAGSDDITITIIIGTDFKAAQTSWGRWWFPCALWSYTDGHYLPHQAEPLQLSIISDTQLTAKIPAALLKTPASAQIAVGGCDAMAGEGWTGASNWIPFTVVESYK